MPDVAVVGNLVKDIVEDADPRPGGVVYYTARAFAALDATDEVSLVTRCAEADRDLLLAPLEAFGIRIAWRPAEATQIFRFHYEGDHRVMHIDQLGDQWTEEDMRGWAGRAIGDAGTIMLGALTRHDFAQEALFALAEKKRRLVIDAQAIVRLSQTGPLTEDGEVDPKVFSLIDALKLSDDEAKTLVGSVEPEMLRTLGIPEVVVTKGSRGALVVTPEADEHVPAVRIAEPVDPTGAGDTFWVAYLHHRDHGVEPVEAAQRASRFVADMLTRAE
jgi:sugar/nucleoside kinase (ribokinase family)